MRKRNIQKRNGNYAFKMKKERKCNPTNLKRNWCNPVKERGIDRPDKVHQETNDMTHTVKATQRPKYRWTDIDKDGSII